jgi:hypothetical protein
MNHIHVKKFGFACGLTCAILYLGCMLLMILMGHDGTVKFFNSILHGIDVSLIVRMSVPLWEALMGIIEVFIIGWLVGACIAGIYNAGIKGKVN